ncbi:hypothetical protein DL95DRAFT_451659 [Leptodontidium sp. 2 PMI_412]|nr:hypothetical protein DL95DRAFT_451659 [Leptodontidium sp. 2 PMI_412]
MQLSRMSFSTAICFALVALAAAEIRPRKDDLSFCFGDGAYCTSALDLYDECRDLQNNIDDLNPWYECICANGYLSTEIACNWCQAAYHLTYTVGLTEDQTETCKSESYSIAPIPATVQALQSSLNATYTGIVPGANDNSDATTTGTAAPSATSGSDSSVTSKSDSSATSGGAAATTSTPRIGISATESTFVSTVTFNGGADGAGAARSSTTTEAQQQSVTSTPSATPTGAAQGGRNGFAVGFSILISAIGGLIVA